MGKENRVTVWKRAAKCTGTATCVEVGDDGEWTYVRDSKNKSGPILSFDGGEWSTFIAAVKAGEYDWTLDDGPDDA